MAVRGPSSSRIQRRFFEAGDVVGQHEQPDQQPASQEAVIAKYQSAAHLPVHFFDRGASVHGVIADL
jgi:hypothetical protein